MRIGFIKLALAATFLVILDGCGASDNSDSSATELTPTTTVALGDETAEALTETTIEADSESASDSLFPDVTDGSAESEGDNLWTISATISSPYESADRYADAWRVLDSDGEVLGIRELAHDHANEQPFTRSLNGVEIPESLAEVTIEGHDQINGWGGQTFVISLPK